MPTKINLTHLDETSLAEAGDILASYAAAEAKRRGIAIPPITAAQDDSQSRFEQAVDQLLAIAQAKPAAPKASAPAAKPAAIPAPAAKAASPAPQAAQPTGTPIQPTLSERSRAARSNKPLTPKFKDPRSLSERCRAAR